MNTFYHISYMYMPIVIMVRGFANDPEDQGSIPGLVIPKPQKWCLIPPCLTTLLGID